jgi:hypothetical protein
MRTRYFGLRRVVPRPEQKACPTPEGAQLVFSPNGRVFREYTWRKNRNLSLRPGTMCVDICRYILLCTGIYYNIPIYICIVRVGTVVVSAKQVVDDHRKVGDEGLVVADDTSKAVSFPVDFPVFTGGEEVEVTVSHLGGEPVREVGAPVGKVYINIISAYTNIHRYASVYIIICRYNTVLYRANHHGVGL